MTCWTNTLTLHSLSPTCLFLPHTCGGLSRTLSLISLSHAHLFATLPTLSRLAFPEGTTPQHNKQTMTTPPSPPLPDLPYVELNCCCRAQGAPARSCDFSTKVSLKNHPDLRWIVFYHTFIVSLEDFGDDQCRKHP